MSKKIKSSCGNYDILIDDEDYVKIISFSEKWSWEARKTTNSNTRYALIRKHVKGSSKRKQFLMHRLVLDVLYDRTFDVDHINQNGLDNRKENLRLVTKSQNMKNRQPKKNGTSKYLGVSYINEEKKNNKNWRVAIKPYDLKNSIHIGYYECEEQAGYAYNIAAKIIHKEYGNLNEVDLSKIIDKTEIQKYIEYVVETRWVKKETPKPKWMYKLTEIEVRNIRDVYELGEVTTQTLAKKYDVSDTTIKNCLKYKKYSHVDPERKMDYRINKPGETWNSYK